MGVSNEPKGFLAKLFSSLGSALGMALTGASGKAAGLFGFGALTAVLAAVAMGFGFLAGDDVSFSALEMLALALDAIGLWLLGFVFEVAILLIVPMGLMSLKLFLFVTLPHHNRD